MNIPQPNFDRICEAFASAQHKEPDELTDLERMAVYFFAGVEVEFVMGDDKKHMTMRTKRPCGLVKVDGKFRVAEMARQRDYLTISKARA